MILTGSLDGVVRVGYMKYSLPGKSKVYLFDQS